jgi:hypothetical protein
VQPPITIVRKGSPDRPFTQTAFVGFVDFVVKLNSPQFGSAQRKYLSALRVAASLQCGLNRFHQLLNGDRTAIVPIELRASVYCESTECDVHAANQLLHGNLTVTIAIANAG